MKGLDRAGELSLHPAGGEGPVVQAIAYSVSLHEQRLRARPEKSAVNETPRLRETDRLSRGWRAREQERDRERSVKEQTCVHHE